MYANEKEMYPDIIESISATMNFYGYKYSVYKTWKEFDPELKKLCPNVISILNKGALPDITVVYENAAGEQKRMIIEVKKGQLIVKDVAQAKIYGDIFDADSVLLVSLKKIRKSFVEFSLINKNFLTCANGAKVYACVLDNRQLQTQNCFPSDGGWIK